jgi:hypothetical protein
MSQYELLRPCVMTAVSIAALTLTAPARAQREERVVTIEDEPSAYPIEIEPHFTFGPDNVY